MDEAPETSGYHAAPPRPRSLTIVLFVTVVAAAVAVAHLFRHTAEIAIGWYSAEHDPVTGAASIGTGWLFAIVSTSVFIAAWLGHAVDTRRGTATGIEAVAASARGERRRISLRASAVRATATWLASSGLSSIGRESAIIEMGGACGTVAGRRARGRGDALATAGIAAAFAAAYHAPLAAVLYLEEHLRVVRSRRALWFATTGALFGHLLSARLLAGHAVFPAPTGSRREVLGLSLVVLVPAATAARAFRVLRVRVKAAGLATRLRAPWWSVSAAFALVAGATVAAAPLTAGNGMEALRHAQLSPTLAIATALSLGKLIGTTASLGSGAPGGALTPTISITAGTALLCLRGVEVLGVAAGDGIVWGVMVTSMAVGLAVGLRSPLLAIALVPELVGDYSLLPLIAIVVAAATVLDAGVDRLIARFTSPVPDVIYDDDA